MGKEALMGGVNGKKGACGKTDEFGRLRFFHATIVQGSDGPLMKIRPHWNIVLPCRETFIPFFQQGGIKYHCNLLCLNVCQTIRIYTLVDQLAQIKHNWDI